MTPSNTAAAIREPAPVASAIPIPLQVSPPSFAMAPRRIRNRGLFPSTLLHALAMAAVIWLPRFIPASAVILPERLKKSEAAEAVPLVLPQLPPLASQGAGSPPSSRKAALNTAQSIAPPVEPPLEEPDYVKPQSIVSVVPNAVNRVQTILRPDLVRPPAMKFPVRLQSMVNLPAAALPVLNPPHVESQVAPVIETANEIPLPELTVQTPVLTLAQKASVVKPVPAPAKNQSSVAPNFKALAKVQGNALKAVIVVNAVDVEPDSAVPLPDAQLAGLFVVGPSPDTNAAAKSLVAGNGHAPAETPVAPAASPSHPSSDGGTASGSGKDRSAIASAAPATVSIGSGPGSGSGSGSTTSSKSGAGAGEGAGSGSVPGSGSTSGSPGGGSGSGNTTGISISGGRGSATVGKAAPVNRSYGMMIISGGSSGGASRDLGVFDRTETVYSVTIPMSDAGGGPDWTMQYALLNRSQSGSGLMVPPFVQKKFGATMPKPQLVESGPVFVTGVIDETGKLQGLRALRVQDARSQPALHALQQWEFLPAQLDGKAVPSKVLIGVTVIGSE